MDLPSNVFLTEVRRALLQIVADAVPRSILNVTLLGFCSALRSSVSSLVSTPQTCPSAALAVEAPCASRTLASVARKHAALSASRPSNNF
jgi:hypothetical protein